MEEVAVEQTQVVVVGGGATGTGILRDLALRGVDAVLIEQFDLAHGTTSRFHGLLHSGARYAVNDPDSARECIQENKILRKVAKTCIEETAGMFVQLPEDDPKYVELWLIACKEAGIPVTEIPVKQVLELEPNLAKNIRRAFVVPDAAIDGFRLVWANAASAKAKGARIYTYTKLEEMKINDGKVVGIKVLDTKTKKQRQINCNYVINATGAWAGEVAAKAGIKLPVIKNKGTLLVFNHRITSRVVNRLRQPGDGDIIVPHGTVAIFGTTSISVDSPDSLKSSVQEAQKLLALGKELVPEIENFRVLRSFAGVRPLYQKEIEAANQFEKASGVKNNGRAVTRGFALVDHEKDGVSGIISVVGGKLTTYRLMAEKTVDYVGEKLGITAPCQTAAMELVTPASKEQVNLLAKFMSRTAGYKLAERLGFKVGAVISLLQQRPSGGRIICDCEQVTMAEIILRLQEDKTATLNDIRRKTRMGMGTCQGNGCISRAVTQLYQEGMLSFGQTQLLLKNFLEERWRGSRQVLGEDQIRQTELMRNKYLNLLNIDKGADRYEI
jgi:glycerol-3-phosphate dehydrogenase